jgi:hypothetical protein
MQFADGAKKHMEGTAKMNFTKLDGFCRGPCVRAGTVVSTVFNAPLARSKVDTSASCCAWHDAC